MPARPPALVLRSRSRLGPLANCNCLSPAKLPPPEPSQARAARRWAKSPVHRLTLALNGEPAIWPNGVPLLPVMVPGAEVSPGTSSCNWLKAPAVTVIAELVPAVLLASVTSVAVTVRLPAALHATERTTDPEVRAALGGKMALLSEEDRPTVCVALSIRFQFASTALMVTLNGVPAICEVGAPVLPVALPG